jgi:protein SCO1/2
MKPGGRTRHQQADRTSLTLASASVAAILGLASVFLWFGSPRPPYGRGGDTIGGPFSLVDDHGNAVTERSFPGKFLIVYFGYSQCHDVCPATLNTLSASLDRLGRKADAVQPLFVTIDPAHDNSAVLRRYVSAFSNRLVGLGGSEAQLRKVADEYGVLRTYHSSPAGGIATVLDHSSVLYLMSPDGRFIAPIPADAGEMVMAQTISRFVS